MIAIFLSCEVQADKLSKGDTSPSSHWVRTDLHRRAWDSWKQARGTMIPFAIKTYFTISVKLEDSQNKVKQKQLVTFWLSNISTKTLVFLIGTNTVHEIWRDQLPSQFAQTAEQYNQSVCYNACVTTDQRAPLPPSDSIYSSLLSRGVRSKSVQYPLLPWIQIRDDIDGHGHKETMVLHAK
ncbi:hypothetical protein MP228_009667 [Amoeboaphelidium protococcarum]|nr:hypothetical protein MP228_009667 [Amoeboaphelidium protococcarum]